MLQNFIWFLMMVVGLGFPVYILFGAVYTMAYCISWLFFFFFLICWSLHYTYSPLQQSQCILCVCMLSCTSHSATISTNWKSGSHGYIYICGGLYSVRNGVYACINSRRWIGMDISTYPPRNVLVLSSSSLMLMHTLYIIESKFSLTTE